MNKFLKGDQATILAAGQLFNEYVKKQKLWHGNVNEIKNLPELSDLVVEDLNLQEIPRKRRVATMKLCQKAFLDSEINNHQPVMRVKQLKRGRKSLLQEHQMEIIVIEVKRRIDVGEIIQSNLSVNLTQKILRELIKLADPEFSQKLQKKQYSRFFLSTLKSKLIKIFESPSVVLNKSKESSARESVRGDSDIENARNGPTEDCHVGEDEKLSDHFGSDSGSDSDSDSDNGGGSESIFSDRVRDGEQAKDPAPMSGWSVEGVGTKRSSTAAGLSDSEDFETTKRKLLSTISSCKNSYNTVFYSL